MTDYRLCAECGEKRDRPQHRAFSIRRWIGHPFVDPRVSESPPPVATYTVPQATREGFVEVRDVTALPAGVAPEVGDRAVVHARGDLRLGIISRIGRTTIYVAVATPTSPDLVTQARIGGRWRERGYLKPKTGDQP